ncbi:hypothetical protein ABFO59_06290 [Acinetobacter radioresistens]|uniref:hypothetical protein n=1 Tax=Acinetobacter radioresistens TaxID=40216 RepID=UPI003215274C
MTENNINDQHEEILVELVQVKHQLSLCSKMTIAEGETITNDEINALFSSFANNLSRIIDQYQRTI